MLGKPGKGWCCPKGKGLCYKNIPPFEVVVEGGLEARPKQHIDSVEKAVQDGHPPSLHDHRVRVGDLDHEEESNAITAGREVALEILDAQGQRSREDLVESLVGLALRGLRVRPYHRTKQEPRVPSFSMTIDLFPHQHHNHDSRYGRKAKHMCPRTSLCGQKQPFPAELLIDIACSETFERMRDFECVALPVHYYSTSTRKRQLVPVPAMGYESRGKHWGYQGCKTMRQTAQSVVCMQSMHSLYQEHNTIVICAL